MTGFNDISTEIEESFAADAADTDDWSAFDGAFGDDIPAETEEYPDPVDVSDPTPDQDDCRDGLLSEADKAADYARSFGFDKAADYIARHYDGTEFVPGMPIPITTRNMGLDGLESDNGIPFTRRTADLVDGLSVEGVFPDFDSIHHVELGNIANDMSIHQQFNACREDFQDHMYDDPDHLRDISFGAMERMDEPQGYAPEGYTWQHNPETGSFDLVSRTDHSIGHTGGNALWGK